MSFIRNIQFTRTVKAAGRLREFNFRKLGGIQDGLFTVDVVDDRGNRVMFRMQKDDQGWKIIPQALPDWVVTSEKLLSELIEEELQAEA